MFINVLVASMTVILLGFVVAWLRSPQLRSSLELPKYPVAQWDPPKPRGEVLRTPGILQTP